VGITSNTARRLISLQAGNPSTLALHYAVRMAQAEAQAVEAWAHFVLRWRLVAREWFEVTQAEAAWAVGVAVAIVGMGALVAPRCRKLPLFLPSIFIPGIVDEVIVPELSPLPASRPRRRLPNTTAADTAALLDALARHHGEPACAAMVA